MNHTIKTYLSSLALVSLIFFGFLFHIHFLSNGGPYNSRNMFGWIAMILTLWALWMPALMRGEIKTPKLFIWPLFLPVLSLTVFLALKALTGSISFSAMAYPALLLIFALVLLGGQQTRLSKKQWLAVLLIVCIGALPQSLMTLSDVGIVDHGIILQSVSLFYARSFYGFSQANLMGSFLASLIALIGWGLYSLEIRNRFLIVALYLISVFFTLIISLNGSKTGVLGMFGAVIGLLGYVFWTNHKMNDQINATSVGPISPTALVVVWSAFVCLTYVFDSFLGGLMTKFLSIVPFGSDVVVVRDVAGINQNWQLDGRSYSIRLAMWYIAWEKFLEAPILGHGLGSFHSLYLQAFSEYGVRDNLIFKENLDNPHNLVLSLLVETGSIGLISILGPYMYALVALVRQNVKNVLVFILLFPILLHTQLEYPYLQSSTHFWLFAVLLTAVTHMNAEKDEPAGTLNLSRRKSLFGNVVMVVLGGLFIATAYSTAYNDTLATKRFKAMQVLSLNEILAKRFTHSDVRHPIVGTNNSDTAVIYLTERATREGQVEMLEQLLFPMYEAQISEKYSSIALWNIELKALLALKDFAKAEALIHKVSLLRPDIAETMAEELFSYRQDTTLPPPQ